MPYTVPPSRRGRSSPVAAAARSSQAQLAGLIMKLPPKQGMENPPLGIPDGCYDHPFVILSPALADGAVAVLLMTSLGNRDLLTKFPRRKNPRKAAATVNHRRHYLPIAPADPHPDLDVLLHLRDPARMVLRKKSYVSTEKCYHGVPLARLRRFHGLAGPDMALAPDSYRLVAERAGYAPPPPRPAPGPGGLLAGLPPEAWAELLPALTGALPAVPARRTPLAAGPLYDDHGDCRIDIARLRGTQAARPARVSYGALPVSRAPRRSLSPGCPSPREPRWLSGHGGGAPPHGFLWRFLWFVVRAAALALLGYGGYWMVTKGMKPMQLPRARGQGGAGAAVPDMAMSVGDNIRGAWGAVVGGIPGVKKGAEDGVRAARASVVGLARRADPKEFP